MHFVEKLLWRTRIDNPNSEVLDDPDLYEVFCDINQSIFAV